MNSSSTSPQADTGSTNTTPVLRKSPDRKASFSQARLAELQSIQRSSSVREISRKFEGSKAPETQESFQKKFQNFSNSDRLLKFAISTNQRSPSMWNKSIPKSVGSPNRNINVATQDSESDSQSSSPVPVSPQLSPILKDHQQWTIEKKSAILSQWSQAMINESSTASITKSAAEASLANLGISPLTLDREQWQEWHDAIEEIVSKHQSPNAATLTNDVENSPQTSVVTRLFDTHAESETPGSSRVDTSNEDQDSEMEEDKANMDESGNDTDEECCVVEVFNSETLNDANYSRNTVATPEKTMFDHQHLSEFSASTIRTTHLFDSISSNHSEVTNISDAEDSVNIEINKRVKKKSPPTRNENNIKIRRGSLRGSSGAIHITNNVVLDHTAAGKDEKPEQLNWLHLMVAVLSLIILSGLGYYFASINGLSITTANYKPTDTASFSNMKLADVILPKPSEEYVTPSNEAVTQVFAVNSFTGSNATLLELDPTLFHNSSTIDVLAPVKEEPTTFPSNSLKIDNIAVEKDITTPLFKTPLPLAVSEYVPSNELVNAGNSNEEQALESSPISMKISITVRKPTPIRRWKNPFAVIGSKLGSFFGKVFRMFSRKKKI